LDLVGGGRWTVLTGLTGAWGDAAAKVGAELGLDLRAVRIGDPGARDAYGDWSRLSGINEDGCLLIRPDAYVAWRHTAASTAPAKSLLTALRSLLDRA
jgi:2,4-dichlorophenol 6-monooxygenase